MNNFAENNKAKIKREIQETIAEIGRGEYISIDEAFEKAIDKIKAKVLQNEDKYHAVRLLTEK